MAQVKKKKESIAELRTRAARIAAGLRKLYPEPECALIHRNPFELLMATILSAQCTDAKVNTVTPGLFKKYKTPQAMAAAKPADVEKIIQPTGFFRQKTKSLIGCSRGLVDRYGGEVPVAMEDLTTLPGVGRKTANVVRGHAMGLPGIAVDTHVRRVSGRLGLTQNTDPEKIERDLMAILPEGDWTHFANALIWHGRRICIARRPKCHQCLLLKDCPTGRVLSQEST